MHDNVRDVSCLLLWWQDSRAAQLPYQPVQTELLWDANRT